MRRDSVAAAKNVETTFPQGQTTAFQEPEHELLIFLRFSPC